MVQLKHLIVLAPFALMALADDHNSNTDYHGINYDPSTTELHGGASFGGCGIAAAKRGGAPVQRRMTQDFGGGNFASGSNQGNMCRRHEDIEAANETRDIHHGFDVMGMLQARDDHTSNTDYHGFNFDPSTTEVHGGAYFGGCRRSDIHQDFGGGNFASGSNQGNMCSRSTQLALRDVGGMYRRFSERDLDGAAADDAAEMLRRHAEHLGLLNSA